MNPGNAAASHPSRPDDYIRCALGNECFIRHCGTRLGHSHSYKDVEKGRIGTKCL